jgi:hypothetical protein
MALRPLGFWPLNGDATDVSGNGNNGAVQNGAFFTGVLTSPVEPQVLVVNSAKKHFISMPSAGSSIFNLGSLHPLTALAWIKTTRQMNDFLPILGKIDPATLTGWAMGLDNSGNGNGPTGGQPAFVFVVSGNPTLLVEAPQIKNDGGWHLIAATYDGSGSANGARLYIDGLPVINAAVLADSVSSGSILNSAPLTIGATTDGGFQFEGNISGAAVFGVALTPAQILQLADDAATARAIMGQFAFGGGWYSALYFSNISLSDVSFTVNFTGDNGSPLNVPGIGTSKTVTLGPQGSIVIEAPNVGALAQGYATMFLPIGVTGYGVFRQSVPGLPDQEAVAPLSVANVNNVTLTFDETNYITGVAIVNTGGLAQTGTITATDKDGNVIGTSPLTLPPFNKTEGLLRSFPGLSQIAGKQGTARFNVTTGAVVVLGLRAKGTALTSIPTLGQFQIFKFIGAP